MPFKHAPHNTPLEGDNNSTHDLFNCDHDPAQQQESISQWGITHSLPHHTIF